MWLLHLFFHQLETESWENLILPSESMLSLFLFLVYYFFHLFSYQKAKTDNFIFSSFKKKKKTLSSHLICRDQLEQRIIFVNQWCENPLYGTKDYICQPVVWECFIHTHTERYILTSLQCYFRQALGVSATSRIFPDLHHLIIAPFLRIFGSFSMLGGILTLVRHFR